MKPIKFKPYWKATIWGGESWQLSGVKGFESVAEDGQTLPALVAAHKGALVGEGVYAKYGNEFPLLIKFIDARQCLSVQVHPDDALAAKRHGCRGKTEMWYIVKADPGAKIYAGLSRASSPEDYVRRVSEGDGSSIQDIIACHESHAGDVFFLPAGRLHAIGAGNYLAEIQETSDITYRVYDFGRRDANGNTRELHIEQAKDAIDYTVYPEYRVSYDETLPVSQLVSCEHFVTHRVVVDGAANVDFGCDSFVVVICLVGEVTVNGVVAKAGETILVPACDNALEMTGKATLLTSTL